MESRNLAQAYTTFIHARVTAEVADIRQRHHEGCDKVVLGGWWADCDCDADGVGDRLRHDYAATLRATDRFFTITQHTDDEWAAGMALSGLRALASPFKNHPDYPQDVEDQS